MIIHLNGTNNRFLPYQVMSHFLLLYVLLSTSCMFGQEQVNNRLINVRIGYTYEQIEHSALIKDINDTAKVPFRLVHQMPSFSYAHEFVLSPIFSLGGTIGFDYMNVFRGDRHFGSSFFFASVDPRLSLFSRERFEYYMKLRVGLTIWTHDLSQLDDFGRRMFPERANFFTGITLGGFNFFLNERWGVNLELSIWSPELVAAGLTYRFRRDRSAKKEAKKNKSQQE